MKNRFIVYYKIDPHFWGELPKKMWTHKFFLDYKPVEVMTAKGVEDVYARMQGDIWSPNGEQRDFIRMLGLSHTSMMVGDVVYSEDDDRFYIAERFGFDELVLESGLE